MKLLLTPFSDLILPNVGMNATDAIKNLIINQYQDFGAEIGCENSTSLCQSTPEEYDSTFDALITNTFKLMGLPDQAITSDLKNNTRSLYDNCVAGPLCTTDCPSNKTTYQDWTAQMGDLFVQLGVSQPSDALKNTAVDAIQARIVKMRCELGCIIKIQV